MCYGCNGCNRCGKMDRLRKTLGRRLCFECGAEASRTDKVCKRCGAHLRPLAPKAGVSSSLDKTANTKESE